MSAFGEGLFGGYKTGHKNPSATRYVSGGKVGQQVIETVEDILTYPMMGIPERGITEETAKHFGIRVKLDGKTGLKHEAHYFPYYVEGVLSGFKKRDLTKPKQQAGHFSVVGFQSVQCEPFGQHAANKTRNKTVIITEGEYDAAIVWQAMRENYKGRDGSTRKINPTVISVSNGTSNAVRNLGQKKNLKYVEKHEQIVLCFDADKATDAEKQQGIIKGKEATAQVYSLIPQMRVADLPDDKDPCDMYGEGMANQLFWSIMKPIEYIPDGFRTYEQIRTKAQEIPVLGRPWPWPTMTKKTLGRRIGEGYFIGAGVKMGWHTSPCKTV
ncbi:toprim domain-containing protein [Burkholderia pseudomallei]|jgi:twinkle protein|uniref:toprim domain-containing protein n=1 Tax=Burkholderia pseudomallei TaxID=28450 RepID=UPI0024DFDC46|nr:toprim domain-containing protein [Burkholderia pseudomallei]